MCVAGPMEMTAHRCTLACVGFALLYLRENILVMQTELSMPLLILSSDAIFISTIGLASCLCCFFHFSSVFSSASSASSCVVMFSSS